MVWMILRIVSAVLRLANLALIVYCIMSFVMPQSDLYRKLGSYVEPVLYPVRQKLYGWFPRLRTLPVDLSPLTLWLALDIATSLLTMLRRAL